MTTVVSTALSSPVDGFYPVKALQGVSLKIEEAVFLSTRQGEWRWTSTPLDQFVLAYGGALLNSPSDSPLLKTGSRPVTFGQTPQSLTHIRYIY